MSFRAAVASATLVMVSLMGSAVAATAADPGQLFVGKTKQGRDIGLRLGSTGRIVRVTLGWRMRCGRRGATASEKATVLRIPRSATRTDTFGVTLVETARLRGGYRVRLRLRVVGVRDVVHGDRWSGTIDGSTRVTRRGRRYDTCRLTTTAWSATLVRPPAAGDPAAPSPAPAPPPSTTSAPGSAREPQLQGWRFEMSGDAGDYITGGKTWIHQPPNDRMSVGSGASSSRASFSVQTPDGGTWSIDFAAPTGQRFAAGQRWTGARRYPFQDDAPGLSISGMGRGCNTLTGEFTIHEFATDTRGYPTRFRASFVQHCEGGSTAARGTLEMTAA